MTLTPSAMDVSGPAARGSAGARPGARAVLVPSSPDGRPDGDRAWVVPSARRLGALCAVALAAAAAVGLLVPDAGRAGPALLVVAGLVGLPHGAVDHLALDWSRGRDAAPTNRLLAAYVAGAVATAALALAFPVPAVLALLALSVLHFAEGEAAFDRLRGGAGLRLPALSLGLSVVALPVLLRPEPVRPLLAALDPGLPGVLAPLRAPVLAATALLVLAGLAVAAAHRAWTVLAELALVAGSALVVPPLLVFAVWFGAWHAPRHVLRLLALQPDGTLPVRLRRLVRAALLPTAAAVSGLAALALGGRGLPAAVLVVLLALTVPHAVVVARIGRAAGA